MSGLDAHARRRLCLNRQISQTQGVSLVPPRPVLCDESSKRVQSGEPTLSPLFPIQAIDNAPVAGVRPDCLRRKSITHIYPNFLFHGLKGTPSFPPVISEMRGDERLRPFAPERRAGRTSRAAAPGRDVGQVCAKGGHFR